MSLFINGLHATTRRHDDGTTSSNRAVTRLTARFRPFLVIYQRLARNGTITARSTARHTIRIHLPLALSYDTAYKQNTFSTRGTTMASISFRAKVEKIYNADDTVAFERIQVPALTRSHCDMASFRQHPKYGSYANSDLFPGMLAKIRRERVVGQYGNHIRLDKLPEGVQVDTSGFLAVVRVDV